MLRIEAELWFHGGIGPQGEQAMIKRWALFGAALACGVFGAGAEAREWRFDFEAGAPAELKLMGASVTREARVVVAGKASLLADFREAGGSWHEFVHTGEVVQFEKGRTYAVRFRYRIVSNEDKETRFYSQLRSRAGKGDEQGDNWQWSQPTGRVGHINRLFTVPHDGGYYLMIGVRGRGAIAIDDLEIREARPNAAAAKLRLETRPSQIDKRRAAFDRLAGTQRMSELVDNLLVITLNEGAGDKATSRTEQIAADLQPDFVDWNLIGPLAKSQGVRSSTGGCEYQEYYKFEGDANPAVRDRVWNDRYRLFGDSGFVMTLENTIIADESWGEGGYFTCHNGENWHRHFLDSLLPKAQRFLAITQDNIACSVFNRVQGCYCPGCQARFRKELAARFDAKDLASAGIDDVESFSIQDYIVDHGLIGEAAVADPIVRAYMQFEYTSGILAWAHCVEQAKAVARRQGRPLPCGGNQINIWGTWPYAVTLSQFCDFVEIEELVGVRDKMQRRSLQYKMGLASGHHAKPVWVRGPVTDETRDKSPMLSTAYWQVHFAEGLANGGVREFSLGVNKPWTGEPNTMDYIDDVELYRLYVDFSRWMRDHRALLTNRQSEARVCVVYSLPSLMFRRVEALRTPDHQRLPRFEDVFRTLDRSQVPCDAVIFGHPEIWDDTKTFERMRKQYDVIVLPGVDALTDAQIKLLGDRQREGVVILADEAFERDENLNPRPGVPEQPSPEKLTEETLLRRGRAAQCVELKAPETVSVNVWRSCGGKSFDVHLVNYDVDIAGEKVRPAADVVMTVDLPKDLHVTRCVVSHYGEADREVTMQREGERAVVRLPQLGAYAIVSFTDANSIERAQRALDTLRQNDRQRVKVMAQRYNLY